MNLSRCCLVEYLSAAHYFQQRSHDQWLIGIEDWTSRTQTRLQELSSFIQGSSRPRILLNLTDPSEFLAAFMAACITESPVFLGNPNWSQTDWQHVLALTQPQIIWQDAEQALEASPSAPFDSASKGWIMIPTGGSSGQVRFAIHTWSTLMASVQACRSYFETARIHSCCMLPLYHVSGLMQFLRSLATEGTFVWLPFKDCLEGTSIDPIFSARSHQLKGYFLSLVPTQLQRLLQKCDGRLRSSSSGGRPVGDHWLAQFQTVLLGGAPAWPELLQTAREYGIRLAPTYGMTETASQIVTLKPDDFLQGNDSSGQVLPHAQITIQDDQQQSLSVDEAGRITIQCQSLCLGYYPEKFECPGQFVTDDLGYLSHSSSGQAPYLHVVGRHSRKIISGGENIFPEEIETAIQATGLVSDVYVTGIADADWGEVAITLYTPHSSEVSATQLKTELKTILSSFKVPKYWIAVKKMPRNAQGKVNLKQVEKMMRSHLEAQASAE